MWVLILTANVFFRAESVSDAIGILYAIVGGNGITWPSKLAAFVLAHFNIALNGGSLYVMHKKTFLLAACIIAFAPSSYKLLKSKLMKPNVYWLMYILLLFMMTFFAMRGTTEFVYFQF